jgi:hypothetical protein
MNRLAKLVIIAALILGIGSTGFAFDNSELNLENAAIDKPSKKKFRRKRSSRRNINPYAGKNRVIRVGKLPRRKVREFYRRMMDIHLN